MNGLEMKVILVVGGGGAEAECVLWCDDVRKLQQSRAYMEDLTSLYLSLNLRTVYTLTHAHRTIIIIIIIIITNTHDALCC